MGPKSESHDKAPRWDIESIFPGGAKSKEFTDFRKNIIEGIEAADKTLNGLPRVLDEHARQQWAEWILQLQKLAEHLHLAAAFVGCLTSQNVDDMEALKIDSQINELSSKLHILSASLESFAIKQSDEEWEKLLGLDGISDIRFFLDELRTVARMKMPEEKEKLALELAVNGYHAWNMIYDKMAGDLRIEVEEDGKKKTISLGQNANRMADPDRAVRRDAFEKMESAWETRADYAALILNSLAGFRLSIYKNRSWDSFLQEALLNCRMQRETVEAMWQAVSESGPKLREYVDAKKKILGIDKFCWYDQQAPVGKIEKSFTFAEAGDFVVEHLGSFSQDMGEYTRMALNNRWVEAEDRPGKRGGAWCTQIPIRKESRVFMTFSSNYSGLETLAHELGHAYHGFVLKDVAAFARHYPMTLAETASIFNELRVADAAFETAASHNEKIMLLDQHLQGVLTFFTNIRARFLFDSWFHQERRKGMVTKERLSELMIKAQKDAFFGILDEKDGFHPLFWCTKLHFYLTGVPFYNFPYTFGFLFANGVYDRAVKEGKSFARNYRALLADSGKTTTEQVAQKHLGLNLTKMDFWNDAVERVLSNVDRFVKLCGEK